MMTKLISFAIIGLTLQASLAQAVEFTHYSSPTEQEHGKLLQSTTQAHAYRKSISGPTGCSMPAEADKPDADDCILELGSIETGTWFFQEGEDCNLVTVELEKMETISMGEGKYIDLPSLRKTTENVACPI